MSTDSTINGQKIEKDNLIFEVLGCLDQSVAEIGFAKLKSGENINQILTQVQKDLSGFSSIVAGCKKQEASPRMVAGTDSSEVERSNLDLGGETGQKLDWLEDEIKSFEESVEIPQKFVIPGKSELEVRLNLSRVAVRKTERRVVSLNRYQDLPEDLLEYLNRLSWLLFLLAISH